jgi:thiamine biosynthesis lipoprotein ApbE
MTRFIRIAVCLAVAVLWGAGPGRALAGDYEFYHENVMGTSMELRVRAADEAAARRAEELVLRRIDRLSAIFSGYDRGSEFSRWQSGANMATGVSPELFEVLQAAEAWQARTGGAFDPRVEALSRLWAACARRDRLPDADELASARALIIPRAWRLDPVLRTAERLSDAPLSLDGIAKGFIVERACDAAMAEVSGVSGVMLNVGGDLRSRGAIEGTIGIAAPWADSESSEPLAYIEVQDRSVATSGRSQRGFRIGGRWYSHILDPRSGRPVERVAAATVVAERSVDADAFAKACNVLEPEECLRLARSLPGIEFLIVEKDGRTTRSDGWHRYERPRPGWLASADELKGQVPAAKSGDGDADGTKVKADAKESGDSAAKKSEEAAPWDTDFELVVNFEINRPEAEAGRYRRPYVVVWVEDKDGDSVRTLNLWVSMGGAGPFQWMPDLKRWYVADQERKKRDPKELFFTIARPTRPPGKYRVIWDGKDDHKKQLPAGEYTIWIEAAREHGTYQDIRKKVTIAGKPFTEELKGNVEIRSASIEYRRKAAPK